MDHICYSDERDVITSVKINSSEQFGTHAHVLRVVIIYDIYHFHL